MAVAEGREVAKAPVAGIEAGAQAGEDAFALDPGACEVAVECRVAIEDVLPGRRRAAVVAARVASVAELVVEHAGVDALVPPLRTHGTACRALQRGLRNADVKALLAAVVAHRRIGDEAAEIDAGLVRGAGERGKRRQVDAPRLEQAARQAGRGVVLAFLLDEADFMLSRIAFVQRHVDQIRTRRHPIAEGEQRQVRRGLVAADAKKLLVEGRGGEFLLRMERRGQQRGAQGQPERRAWQQASGVHGPPSQGFAASAGVATCSTVTATGSLPAGTWTRSRGVSPP